MGFVVGQRIADYEVEGVLGTGGMGCIYRVCNVISGRTEAMKVLQADLSAEPELAARFRAEICTLAGLYHPNIAQLHTAIQYGNEQLMIMEFVEGCTLHQLAQQAPLLPITVTGYIQQVLSALSYAHSRGVVHCDVKPANIMVAPQGTVKLMDFGIARLKAKDEFGSPGAACGSPRYMSPEQACGSDIIDERSDIYSLGITLYKLLTGQLPFDDEPTHVLLHRQVNETPRPPIELNPQLSKSLSDLVMKALEKDPAQRFQTAAEFSDRLSEVTGVASSVRGVVTVSPGPARTGVSRILNGRSKLPAEVGVAAAMALAGFTALGVSSWMKATFAVKNVHGIAAAAPVRPGPAGISANAAVAEKKETVVVSYAPAAKVITKPLVVVVRHVALKQPRFPCHVATVLTSEAALPETEGDTLRQEPQPTWSAGTTAELREVRRQQNALNALANTIRSQMARLRNQKIIEGHDLNQGMADAYVEMNQSLNAGSADLESGNAAGARNQLEKAATAVNVLEKLFDQNP
jgi:eukaryotic-like serine/threonine-protein kinase